MRFGLVLADINSGSSLSLLPYVCSMFPKDGKNSLVILPGGRLAGGSADDISRNFIYNFANPSNLDGSIVWSSSLTGDADSEQVLLRFRELTELPIVTISGKTTAFPDIPDVSFDASEGTAELVRHCITKHGIRRFAYIRGPENHRSANQRFEAFVRTLEENGITPDPMLFSDPGPWYGGERGIRQLLNERHLIPGRDFQALFCASDLILLHASLELEKAGYSIPGDVVACGFNDSLEAKLLHEPVTTVRMPYAEMGKHVVRMLDCMVRRQKVSDQILPAKPVIRRSCGCGEETSRPFKDNSELTDYISETFLMPWKDANSLVEKVSINPTESNMSLLLKSLLSKNTDVGAVLTAMSGFKGEAAQKIRDFSLERLPEEMERFLYNERYRERHIFNTLISLEKTLLVSDSVEEIEQKLREAAPSLGFDQIRIHVFNRNGDARERLIMEKTEPGVWIAAPLFTDSDEIGYMLFEGTGFNGYLAEEVRSSVSAAIKSAILLEDTEKARQRAEKAEQARITFFANVGENLRKPLAEISGFIANSNLESTAKREVMERVTGAGHTLDLVLGSMGEIELNRIIVNPGEILGSFECYNGPADLPCLSIDEYWLKEAVSILVAKVDNSSMTASVTRGGVRVDITDTEGNWEETRSSELLLAREIVLLHKGTCSTAKGRFTFTLHYPTLSGETPSAWDRNDPVVFIGGHPSFPVEDCILEEADILRVIQTKRLPAGTGAIFWDSNYNNYNYFSALFAISANPAYRNLPFICVGGPRAKTMEETIHTAVKFGGKTILQVGNAAEKLLMLLPGTDVIRCTVSQLAVMLEEKRPALIVISAEDYEGTMKVHGTAPKTPVLVCADTVSYELVGMMEDAPNVIVADNCIMDNDEFKMRIDSVLRGAEILPVMTGAIVKKAQAYICANAVSAISRWQIAEAVNVSEDYLTRIFRREMGISPWDYLNRYRIALASAMLNETGKPISEIALATGFKDQAYFCRVFKKVTGINPGKARRSKTGGA